MSFQVVDTWHIKNTLTEWSEWWMVRESTELNQSRIIKINNVLHFKGYTSGFMVINRKNRDMVSWEDYCFSKWKHTVGVWGYVVEGLLVFNSWLSSSDVRLPALYCNIVFVSDSGISDLCTGMLICGSLAILICPS